VSQRTRTRWTNSTACSRCSTSVRRRTSVRDMRLFRGCHAAASMGQYRVIMGQYTVHRCYAASKKRTA
jgi:hypothetical protein